MTTTEDLLAGVPEGPTSEDRLKVFLENLLVQVCHATGATLTQVAPLRQVLLSDLARVFAALAGLVLLPPELVVAPVEVATTDTEVDLDPDLHN